MSSSRATGSLLGRLAATAGAVMRRSSSINGSGTALGAIVGGAESSSSSASAMLLAGQRRPHATSSWTKLFKPAQAFFGGINSSGSAASTSAVSAAAVASVSTPAAAAAAPPQFGFAASAAAVAASAARISTKPLSSPPKKAAAAGTAKKDASIKKKKKQAPRGPSAYALFLKEQLSAVPASNDGRSYAQRSAAVAAAWKTLPASAKSRFEAASKAAKLALPPREPKAAKALSGYQLFVREKLPTLRDESAAGGGAVSAMRAVAEAWRAAPAQVKGEFAARAKAMGAKR